MADRKRRPSSATSTSSSSSSRKKSVAPSSREAGSIVHVSLPDGESFQVPISPPQRASSRAPALPVPPPLSQESEILRLAADLQTATPSTSGAALPASAVASASASGPASSSAKASSASVAKKTAAQTPVLRESLLATSRRACLI
jgi:hypothetical protein